jgi:hypothetical protein
MPSDVENVGPFIAVPSTLPVTLETSLAMSVIVAPVPA